MGVQALVDALDVDGSGVLSFRRFLAGAIDKRTIAASQKVLSSSQPGDMLLDDLVQPLLPRKASHSTPVQSMCCSLP